MVLLHFFCTLPNCVIFRQTSLVTETIISKESLKSFYSRLCFKVLKYFAASPNFEEARKRFDYESGKSKELQKKTIGLQFNQTIPQRVTILNDNRIGFN